jgi:hypothetical protein
MNKFVVPLTGAALLLALGAAMSAADKAPARALLLLAPFGHVPPPEPESLPADARVRTRNGAYLTREQADALADELRGEVVWVDVGCCGSAARDVAQGHVAGMLRAADIADDAPVFVSGADLAAATAVVDRLSEQRLTRVFLVTR